MGRYVYKPYEKIFPQLFETEKARLKRRLTGFFEIHHIGSTAVPGLGGKGIIDIYIVTSEKDLERISEELLNAGYMYRPRLSVDQHVFHIIDLPDPIEGLRRYHVHLNHFDSEDFMRSIKFRDFLRSHPEDVLKYAEAKKKASEEANQDKDTYMAIKTPVIEEILEKALKE